ncbi:MAG TPA: PAS domain-containing protein [Coriobacteriia bacterium]
MAEPEDFVGVVLVDAASLAISWSNDYYRGLPRMEDYDLLGRRFGDFMPMTPELRIEESLRRVAETGEPHHETVRVLAIPGRPAFAWRWSVYRTHPDELLVVYRLEGREAP